MLPQSSPAPLLLSPSARCDQPDTLRKRSDARALDRLGLETALRNHVLPLGSYGAIRPIAVPSIADFHRMEAHLRALFGPVVARIAPPEAIEDEILTMRSATLACRAEARAPARESCRTWSGKRFAVGIALFVGLALFAAIAAPHLVTWAVTIWAVTTLLAVTGLRTMAAIVQFRHARCLAKTHQRGSPNLRAANQLPRISLLVPLFKERDIAQRLINRLSRLDYPRERLEICLILEWSDTDTERALSTARLPNWFRVIRVPDGHLRTKPRAMNYALDFLQGDIVGIYDAEDAPAPDQLNDVVRAFEGLPENVACVQGILDFYNASRNWITRCFTIDYAIWFRVILPGLEKMGAVVPLGGTTVFFRRNALESLGRWDAHNVTEDAELGLRLYRRGYRCAFLPTVTQEEATATIPTWVRQRSRWIKGYAMTWAVHMRDPLGLMGDLGLARFLGVQILFLGTLSQFLLAPFLWSFWLVLFGYTHPFVTHAPWSVVIVISSLFLLSGLATMVLAATAVARPGHRWLIKWVPLLNLYFPLAAIASWKGAIELVVKPFYWDKTSHGKTEGAKPGAPRISAKPV